MKFISKVPKAEDERRLIIATCEKGSVEDVGQMRTIKSGVEAIKKANPNFVEIASKDAFKVRESRRTADPPPKRLWTTAARDRAAAIEHRATLRIGMPRVLNMYTYAPFFNGYFVSLGVAGENLVYSDYTSGELYREGAGRGAIDPCFPAKIGVAHVHNLLFAKHAKKKLDCIFFPRVDVLHTPLKHLVGSNACPTVTVTPETAKAAFTKEGDVLAQNKPTGSIKIRVETIHYFLKRYVEDMQKQPLSAADVEREIAKYEESVRHELMRQTELAALGERHRPLAEEQEIKRRMLPVAGHAANDGSETGECLMSA